MSLSHFMFQFSVVGSSFFLNHFSKNQFIKITFQKRKTSPEFFQLHFDKNGKNSLETQFEKLWAQRHILQQKFYSKVRIF